MARKIGGRWVFGGLGWLFEEMFEGSWETMQTLYPPVYPASA